MATGVLVVGVEKATKLLTYLVGSDKSYAATIRLGATTVTDDAEGEVTARTDASGLEREALEAAVRALTGPIDQVPSAVSAIKVDGRRSYARVRSGEQVELPARPVTVHEFDIRQTRAAEDDGTPVLDVDVEVRCSSGTYVRALARDLGDRLGVGGHLTALRRTAVGPYGLDVARTLEQLADEFSVLPLADAARAAMPVRELGAEETAALRFGQRVAAQGISGPVAAISADGALIAVLEERGGTARPTVVFEPA